VRKLVAAALGAVFICGAIALPGGVSTAQAQNGGMEQQDQFPVMTQAITQLQQISAQLSTQAAPQTITQLQQVRHAVNTEAGEHYQGHREKALRLMDRAISQLKQGQSAPAGNAINRAISELQKGVAVAKAAGAK
jgi:hypothetical protein